MRILAIETSAKTVSVALLDETDVILELDSSSKSVDPPTGASRENAGSSDALPPGYVRKRSKGKNRASRVFPPGASALLIPMIKSAVEQAGFPITSIELIAVTIGPGSFTGLRVGVVAAKALAFSNQAHVVGINTLEAIAAQTAESISSEPGTSQSQRICAVVNAQRQQVFAGYYPLIIDSMGRSPRAEEFSSNQILDHEAWIQGIHPGDVLTGPALTGLLANQNWMKSEVVVAPENCWSCRASSVGRLAWKHFIAGKRDSLWELEPLYFRPSAAEEVRNARISRGEST